MSTTLRLKSALVASPLEGVAKSLQWAASLPFRSSHPELTELFLEEKRLPEVLRRLVTKSSNVLDIGCHLGSFLSLARRLAPAGHHIAIEASPTKAGWLARKFPDVQVEQVAVSDHTGTATFEENIRNPGFSRLQGGFPSCDPVNRYAVAVTTLDALNIQHRVDFVKIDIEGAELAAFRGGSEFFAGNRPKILFECGADANAGLDRSALFDHITQEMAYDIFTFGDFLHNKGPLSFDEFRKCGIYPFRAFNFIAIPRCSN
jgi:FkbM family methyltransferase